MKRPAARDGVNRAHIARFVSISVIFISVQIALLGLGWAALKLINTTRAYATGESFYSKATNAAVFSLYKYAETGGKADWNTFQSSLDVTFGDRTARRELDRPDPNREVAIAGFLRGRNNIADIPDAILVFRLCRRWGPFAAAVADWRRGDQTIDRLRDVAAQLHSLWQGAAVGESAHRRLVGEIDGLNAQLTTLENQFAGHIANTARIATGLVTSVLGLLSLLLWSFSIGLAWQTYRKGIAAEVHLMESEERFRNFAETASDWFWETGPDLNVTYLSERFLIATGVSPQVLLGRPASEPGSCVMTDSDGPAATAILAARQAFRGCLHRYVKGNGEEQYWKIGGVPVFDAEGEFLGYRGTGSNVSAEVRAEQALREAKDLSDLANRAKSEFLANMSHELRTPLNAILGFSEIIKDRLFGNASNKYIEYAGDIFNSGTLLLTHIDDMLDLAKIEAGRMELYEEVINVAAVIETATLLLRQKADAAKLRLKVRVAANLPRLRADERKLRQILLNLLSNAIKFTPAGGSISVVAGVRREDGGLEIAVRDTGIGIAADDIVRVMEPFAQIENSWTRRHTGTGLGLPLVKALTELHGGTITLTSRVGCGTDIVITLPRERVAREPTTASDEKTAASLVLGGG